MFRASTCMADSYHVLSLPSCYLFLETASEEESPVLSCSHLNSESSVPEELGSPPAESIPSEIIGHEQPGSPDHSTLTEEIVSSQGLKSTTSPAKLVSDLFMLFTSIF